MDLDTLKAVTDRLDTLITDQHDSIFLSAGDPKAYTLMRLIPQPDGSTKKLPIDLRTGKAMKWKKDPYFVDFKTAISALKQALARGLSDYRIGLLLGGDRWVQPLTGELGHLLAIDLDHVPELVQAVKTGSAIPDDTPQGRVLKLALQDKVSPWYCEVSQSGQGLHLLAVGDKHDETLIRTTSPAFEYYDSDRWITLTGDYIGRPIGYSTPEQIGAIEAIISAGRPKPAKPVQPVQAVETSSSDPALPGKVEATIARAWHSKGSSTFKQLFNGASPSGDASSDDMSFVNRVYFYSGGDKTVTDGVFRASKRMRPKWDEIHSSQGLTYGQLTIERAAETVTEVYNTSEPASFDELCGTLRDAYWAYKNSGTEDGDTKKMKPEIAISMIKQYVHFARLYESKPTETVLYFWCPDSGIWCKDESRIDTLLTAVDPEMVSPTTRQGVRETLRVDFTLPTAPVFRDPRHWLAVQNGLLSLTDFKLYPFSPYIYITEKLVTPYEDKPQKPVFDGWDVDSWITGFADGDEDKKRLLWETIAAEVRGADWLGACVVFADGESVEGGTGKSSLELMIRDIIGADNTQAVKLSDFDDDTSLLPLLGCSHVIGFDSNASDVIKKFDRFKASVVGDPQQIRGIYEHAIEWRAHFFMIQSLNGKLRFENADQAVWDRVKVVRFNKKFRGHGENAKIQKFYIKSPELHKYVLYKALHTPLGDKLTDTVESRQAVADLQKSSDSVTSFVEDGYLQDVVSTVIPSEYLYKLYRVYCDATSQKPDKQKIFSDKLKTSKTFTDHWAGPKRKRLSAQLFRKSDVDMLFNHAKGCGSKVTFLQPTRVTTSDEDGDSKTMQAIDMITQDTYEDYLAGQKRCYVLTEPQSDSQVADMRFVKAIDAIESGDITMVSPK